MSTRHAPPDVPVRPSEALSPPQAPAQDRRTAKRRRRRRTRGALAAGAAVQRLGAFVGSPSLAPAFSLSVFYFSFLKRIPHSYSAFRTRRAPPPAKAAARARRARGHPPPGAGSHLCGAPGDCGPNGVASGRTAPRLTRAAGKRLAVCTGRIPRPGPIPPPRLPHHETRPPRRRPASKTEKAGRETKGGPRGDRAKGPAEGPQGGGHRCRRCSRRGRKWVLGTRPVDAHRASAAAPCALSAALGVQLPPG